MKTIDELNKMSIEELVDYVDTKNISIIIEDGKISAIKSNS